VRSLAFVALAGVATLAGCGSAHPTAAAPASATTPTSEDAATPGAWLNGQPEGCALGHSGPTLKPTDALREARRRARASLVMAVEKIHNKAISSVAGRDERDQYHEVILEQAEGWVRRSTIVALWYDERGVGPDGAAGTAYAAACFPEGAPPATREFVARMEARRAAPSWVYGAESPAGQICAAGLSGPTMETKDALANAEAAARDEVAEGIAAHVKVATGIFDNEAVVGAVTAVPDDCRARAAAGRVVASWTDERGVGPVPFSGMIYVFVCASL
jgi:hypothetical protein